MKYPIKSIVKRLILSALTLSTFTVASLSHAAGTLNVYNWSDYIDDSVIKDFETKTGIKVRYDVFDSNEVLETKLLAGSSGYDIVVPSSYFLSRQIEAGVFEKLDTAKLPNLKNMDPAIMDRLKAHDPDNAHSINYLWGTTGFGYNEAKIKAAMPDAPVNSWDMIFKPEVISKFKDCGVFLLDGPTEVIPAALNYLGLDPKDASAENLKKVEELMEKIRPNIRKFHSSEYISALANGDICLALGWSGDILQAKKRAVEAKNDVVVQYAIPKEGAQMFLDQMAIPKDAKNKDEAYQFLNYLMEPEVMAKISNKVEYASGNLAAKQFVNKTILDNPNIYPPEDVMKRLFILPVYDSKTTRMINRTWTKIKSGQ